MQSSSSSRIFNPTLAGASPATDASPLVHVGESMVDSQTPSGSIHPSTINSPPINQQRSQSVISSARRPAKAEARGASPRESATFIYDLRFMIYDYERAIASCEW